MTLTLNPAPLDREIDGMAFTFREQGKLAYSVYANGNHLGSVSYQGGWWAYSVKSRADCVAEWGKGNCRADARVGTFRSMDDACRFLAREAMGPVGNETAIDGRGPLARKRREAVE